MSKLIQGRWIRVVALAAAVAVIPVVAAAQSAPAATTSKVDINSATQTQLETLPGVTASTAKKIIAGRPYTAVGDLSKAGVSAKVIADITPNVVVGPAQPASSAPAKPAKGAAKSAAAASAPANTEPVDLNTATQAQLENLPSVGPASAKKIIAARPYTTVSDLSKAGLSAKTVSTITPLVTVGKAPAGPAPAAAPAATAPPASSAPASNAPTTTGSKTTPQVPPVKGMVWVNLSTKVYHKEGDPYYGNTKNGKFMTEADAIKAGYRAAKTGGGF